MAFIILHSIKCDIILWCAGFSSLYRGYFKMKVCACTDMYFPVRSLSKVPFCVVGAMICLLRSNHYFQNAIYCYVHCKSPLYCVLLLPAKAAQLSLLLCHHIWDGTLTYLVCVTDGTQQFIVQFLITYSWDHGKFLNYLLMG